MTSPDPSTLSSNLSGLSLQWESSDEYVVSDPSRMLGLKIRTDQGRITLTVRANSTLCADAGTCGMCGYNQTDTSTPDYAAWAVPEATSLFAVLFRDGETAAISPAAHCLSLRGDGISSDILPDVFPAARDLTFAVLVKPESGSGVVMSYGRFTLFGLLYDSSLKVLVNASAHDTGLGLATGQWSELVVVYRAAVFTFDLYVRDASNATASAQVVVSDRFRLEADGVLTLGGWTEVEGEGLEAVPLISGFTGQVDELRVWHRAVTYTDVSASWNARGLFTHPGVFAHWAMNEGRGTVTADRVRGYSFSFYAYDWTRSQPAWRLSSFLFAPPAVPASHSFAEQALLTASQSSCTSALFNDALSSRCPATHEALAQFYYAVCLSDAAAARSPSAALTSLLSLADRCESRQELDAWPGRPLCGLFPDFPRYGGGDCSTQCLFGAVRPGGADSDSDSDSDYDYDSDSDSDAALSPVCECRAGFWGPSCQSTCPGGTAQACGGHGECARDTGRCTCRAGWSGADCSRCSPGWRGSDCSVTVQETTSSSSSSGTRFCSLTANGHLATLDGAGVTFTRHGIFRLFEDAGLSVRVEALSRPCGRFGACVVRAALQVGGDRLLMDALDPAHLVLNGARRPTSPLLTLPSSGASLRALDSLTFELAHHASGLTVRIALREAFLDLHLTSASSACSATEGLCGRCAPGATTACGADDHTCLLRALGVAGYLQAHPDTSSATLQAYLASWKTAFAGSVFSRAAVSSSTATAATTSFAVALSGGYLVTAPIAGAVLDSEQLTVSVGLRISSATNLTSTLVWSYARACVLALLVRDGRLALYFNGTVTATELRVRLDVWSQVALVYERRRGRAVLHYLWTDGGARGRHLHQAVRVAAGALPGGGTLAVGTWQTSLVAATRPTVSTRHSSFKLFFLSNI